jgi:uncharacterized ParB-like nuclease family protein
MSEQDNRIAESIIDKYAEMKGLDKNELRKKVLPVIKDNKVESYVSQSSKVLAIAEVIDKLNMVSQNADPTTRLIMNQLGTGLVANTFTQPQAQPVREEDTIERTINQLAKLRAIDAAMEKGIDGGQYKEVMVELAKLRAEITDTKKSKEMDEVMKQMKELIDPIQKEFEKIKGQVGSSNPIASNDIVTLVTQKKEEAQKIGDVLGYKMVENKGMGPDEVKIAIAKALEEDKQKNIESFPKETMIQKLRDMGYNVEGGPMNYADVKKQMEEMYIRGKEEAFEDKSVEATKELVNNAISQIMRVFQPVIETWIQNAVVSPMTGGAVPSNQPSSQAVATP